MKKSGKIALCGITIALSLVIMFISGLFPLTTYAAPALAGILLLCIVIEISRKYAFMVYIATCILSFLIIPNRESSVIYISLFGYYPMIRDFIYRSKNNTIKYIIKFSIFNVSFFLIYFLIEKIFLIPHNAIENLGDYGVYIFIFLANLAFFLYDIVIDRLTFFYVNRIQPKLTKLFK